MVLWTVNCILSFLLCVFCAGIVIPQILLVAYRKKLFDVPDERKIHQCVVPRLGGIAFKPVIFFTIALLAGINLSLGHSEILCALEGNAHALLYGYCAVLLLYLTGMTDDLVGVKYRAKFVIQILCGVMLLAGGVWLNDFHGILWLHEIPVWVSCPLTILLVVFIINAINLIDGIDGLASGLCGIAFLFYGLTFFALQQYIYAMLAFATLGVLVPFFYYNVFGNPEKHKKIFMGDTGSLTIGIILCLLSIKLTTCDVSPYTTINPIVLAFSPLFVPCCDVVRVYLHRVKNGKNPFLPDKNHIHHKLLAIGMRQRMAMITIVLVSIFFTLFNIVLSYFEVNVNLILVCDLLIWIVANIILTRRIVSKKAKNIESEIRSSRNG